MKRIIILTFSVMAFYSAQSQKVYKSVGGYSSMSDALPAIFYALPSHSGFESFDPVSGTLALPLQRYNDFGVVNKHVDISFRMAGDEIEMVYENHQMEDKTKGEWEDCPDKLTKKDHKEFSAFTDALEAYLSKPELKKEADSRFYSNSTLLKQLLKQDPELAYSMWNANSAGLYGNFSYLMFLHAEENTNNAFDDCTYKVQLEIVEVTTDRVPLEIVMYANPKSKANPDGMHKDIMKLNKKENYWFPNLKAEVVSFTRKDDGNFLMILRDKS